MPAVGHDKPGPHLENTLDLDTSDESYMSSSDEEEIKDLAQK